MATALFQSWLEDDLGLSRGELKDSKIDNQWSNSAIPRTTTMSPPDARVVENLEKEVDALERKVRSLLTELQDREQVDPPEKFSKPLLKPRDIPILELKHLSGVEGAGRLGVFLSQVENCSRDTRERQQIVNMRVDAPLAIFVKNILKRGAISWETFKTHLTAELTDQSEERVFDCLNELRYTFDEDPVEFASRVKCKLAMLEIQTESGDMPSPSQLIKKKLLKGMPRESRDRLELYMDENISLHRFMMKLNTERLVVLSQRSDNIRVVEPPPQPVYETPTKNQKLNRTLSQEMNRRDVGLRQWSKGEKYCPYCRASNHTVAECYRKPRPGSCYDCLRMGCRRGQLNCPGRINMTRNRLL